MNTLSVNNTEPQFRDATFETIVQENMKILVEKVKKLKINEENKDKILLAFEDYNLMIIDKYNEDFENFYYLKQLNKDSIFLDSVKKTLVDKLILCAEDQEKYAEIERTISK